MADEILEVPLAEVGLDRRPNRQVRHLDDEWVRHLALESDPAAWPPILVRPWPAEDPPPIEGACRYQVISGYHRVTAARMRCLPTVRVQVRLDVTTDADFLAEATRGNTQHGKPMDRGEQQAAVRQLAALGMSQGDISKRTGIPKGTVHNYLSEPNTDGLLQVQQVGGDGGGKAAVGRDQHVGKSAVAPVTLTDARRAQIGSTLNDLLATVPTTVSEAELHAWGLGLDTARRERLVARAGEVQAWAAGLAEALSEGSKGEVA